MSCRALALVAFAAACTVDDVPVVDVAARAMTQTAIAPPTADPIAEADGAYRWELVLAPTSSSATAPVGGASAAFLPDLRGTYVVERWLTYGLAETLTHRFVVRAEGAPPTAVARGGSQATVGASIMLDGSDSSSVEGRTLLFRWRLTDRPRDSTATVADATAATTSLVADRAGEYTIELVVFDGELWSSRASLLLIQAQ